MKRLYIIAGCNGAGKTTASFTILPEILDCKEFVNTDEIARGLSPFQPERMRIEAGRIMLERIERLMEDEESFAFETTLASKSFMNLIEEAKGKGYRCTLLFFWLNSPELAVHRVKVRVKEGGHDIPEKDIRRRYERGLKNLFQLYKEMVDNWMLIDNSGGDYRVVAEGEEKELSVHDQEAWGRIKTEADG